MDIPYSVNAFQMEEYEGNCTPLVPEAFPPGETEADRRTHLLQLFYYWVRPFLLISDAVMLHTIVKFLLRHLIESHH